VQVFIFDITKVNDSELHQKADFLSDTEKIRLSNMISVKRQKEFILGHFLLRRLLCEIFDIPMEKALVETLKTGALTLPLLPDVYASISHTIERLAIAVGNVPVGIDIEKMVPRDNFEALLGQIDSVGKAKHLMDLGMPMQEAFYRLWCQREAMYKLKSQKELFHPASYYKQHEKFMLCCACAEQTEIEWIIQDLKNYDV